MKYINKDNAKNILCNLLKIKPDDYIFSNKNLLIRKIEKLKSDYKNSPNYNSIIEIEKVLIYNANLNNEPEDKELEYKDEDSEIKMQNVLKEIEDEIQKIEETKVIKTKKSWFSSLKKFFHVN